MELFSHHLKSHIKDKHKYIEICHSLFMSIAVTQLSNETLIGSGILDYWIESSLADSEVKRNIEERACALSKTHFVNLLAFLTDIWCIKPVKI